MIYQSVVDISEDVDVPYEEGLDLLLEYLNNAAKERGLSPVEETLSKDLEAQEGVSPESITTQIELDFIGNTSADFEGDEEVAKFLKSEEEIHKVVEEPSQTKETYTRDLERYIETLKELDSRSPKNEQQWDNCILLTEECSEILTMEPQQKRNDSRSLPIPCSIGEANIEGALCDFNSNINLMSLSLADDQWEPEFQNMELILTNLGIIYPWGIFKDVPIKVKDLIILVDFVVLEEEIPLILGKPFLAACRILINNQQLELELRMDDKEEAHDEEEDQEEQLVEIETDQRDTSSVRDEDFYKGAEPQPMKIQEQDLQQKGQPSNKAEDKAEIDKVIEMICALFATVKLKRIWKQHPLFLKFMVFLPNKRKKTDDIFHLSYKTP
ncbi:hypothetical protein QL285_021663 [Trifolium repens]|nr:hypothetical protein QL285_021663 [Trifolium repens]